MVIHRTCAVTPSVFLCSAICVGRRHRRSFLAQQIRGSGSPTSWSITRLPPKLVSTSTIPGGSVRTSPISAARSQPGTERSAASARSAASSARRRRRACPRWPRTSGRSPRSRTPRPRPGRPAPPPRARASPPATSARARSAPRPRRRGSRRACSAATVRPPPAARPRPATASACRTRSSASSSNSPRASMIAVPCSPIVPDSRMRSPGRIASAARRARGSRCADAGGADVHAVGGAALDDLGVAGHDLDPAASAARGDRLDLGLQVVRGEALLEDQRQAERERARARHGQVVDGPVHGQVADRAAREAERLDDERVGREGERGAVDLDRRRRPR